MVRPLSSEVEWSIVGSAVRCKCHRCLRVSYIPRKNTNARRHRHRRRREEYRESGTTMKGRRSVSRAFAGFSRCCTTPCPYCPGGTPVRASKPQLTRHRAERVCTLTLFTLTMSRWVYRRGRSAGSLQCGKLGGNNSLGVYGLVDEDDTRISSISRSCHARGISQKSSGQFRTFIAL